MKHNDFFEQRQNFFLDVGKVGRGGIFLGLLLGVFALLGALVTGEYARAWGSFLFNLMFFFSLAVGGVVFGHMQDACGALWGRPVKRLHEGMGSFIPLATGAFFLLFACIKFKLLGAHEIYPWIKDPHMLHHFPGKNTWLQLDFMLIRDAVALLGMLGLYFWHRSMTLKPDLALLAGDKNTAHRLAEANRQKLRYWSPPILVCYALFFSLICFDLTMSLAPTWISTLWGGWSFSIMMHILFASLLLIMFAIKTTPVGLYIKRQQFHDLGKLLFGFTVFYAYLTFAHILTYWYGNVPEETTYFMTRLKEPWKYIVFAIPVLSFCVPFFGLIHKAHKWLPHVAIPISVIVLISQWLNYLLVVIPEVVPEGNWTFPWIELGVFFGFLGAFLFSYARFAKRTPMLAIADPLLTEALHSHH